MQLCSKCRAHGKSSKSAMTILCLGIRACQNLKNTTIHRERGFTKTRQDKTDLTYSTHLSSIHFLQDYLALWYARWWIQRLKQKISTSDFFFRKKILHLTTLWQHFFSRGLNTTKIRPNKINLMNLKMKQMDQSEIHSFNHQLLHLKSSLLQWPLSLRKAWLLDGKPRGSDWEPLRKYMRSSRIGGLEGESIPRGVVMMCRKNTSEIYFCEINIIWSCLIFWMWFDDFEWILMCFLCDIVYMIIMAS